MLYAISRPSAPLRGTCAAGAARSNLQMGQEVLLAGARLGTRRLQELEFVHQYPQLDGALAALVGQG